MFDLENSISDWRKQMLAAGIKTPVPLEELENHLRHEIQRQIKLELNEQRAFETAVQQIGDASAIKMEFKKIDAESWSHPLAWAAWVLFVVSFFLPAYEDARGWQCAWFSLSAWSGKLFADSSANVHLALQTLANVLMIASPILLARLSRNPRVLKRLRFSSFVALILVWSFVFRCFSDGGWQELRIGCYIWASSFLLLCLSTLKIPDRKTLSSKYV
jgi:hypothetical protein